MAKFCKYCGKELVNGICDCAKFTKSTKSDDTINFEIDTEKISKTFTKIKEQASKTASNAYEKISSDAKKFTNELSKQINTDENGKVEIKLNKNTIWAVLIGIIAIFILVFSATRPKTKMTYCKSCGELKKCYEITYTKHDDKNYRESFWVCSKECEHILDGVAIWGGGIRIK